jgi:hypothetical protein
VSDALFEAFWVAYPRKVGKGAAEKAWKKALSDATPTEIMMGLANYKLALQGKDSQFIAHPTTWLNQKRWLDEVGAPPAQEGDAPATKPDPELSIQLQVTKRAYELRAALMGRTREKLWPLVEKAASRINADPVEFWGCMTPGADGLESRAWLKAVEDANGGNVCPLHLAVSPDQWISAKQRYESRARHMKAMRISDWSSAIRTATSPARTQERKPDVRPTEAEDEGMAREASSPHGGLGREHPDGWGSEEDHGSVGTQDWPAES